MTIWWVMEKLKKCFIFFVFLNLLFIFALEWSNLFDKKDKYEYEDEMSLGRYIEEKDVYAVEFPSLA